MATTGAAASAADERLLTCLPTELDGIAAAQRTARSRADCRAGVDLRARRHRPCDPAARPHRRRHQTALPDARARAALLQAWLRHTPHSDDLTGAAAADLADRLDGYSQADIAGLCHEAAMRAVRRAVLLLDASGGAEAAAAAAAVVRRCDLPA